MLSTVLVIHDGYPRTVCALVSCFRKEQLPEKLHFRIYLASILAMILISLSILLFYIQSFKTLIDIATTLAFLTAPVLAWLIHRSMHSADVPVTMRPAPGLTRYSVACIWALALFAVFLPGTDFGGTDIVGDRFKYAPACCKRGSVPSPLKPDNE